MKKYQRYVSIDLDTKHKKFKKGDHERIKSFMLKHHFIHWKDTNYLSKEKLGDDDIYEIRVELVQKLPTIIECIKKFHWMIWDSTLITDDTHGIKQLKKELN